MKPWLIGLIFILITGAGLRFYRFADRIIFGPEQAMSLLISGDLATKPSLLGQPYFRTTSAGHQLFTAPFFNYSLFPLMRLANYRPLIITAFFALLNLTTAGLFYIWLYPYSPRLAFLSGLLFTGNSFMLGHSLFIWSLNWLPLLGLLSLIFLYRFYRLHNFWDSFWLGGISGLIVGLEYFYLFTLVPLAILVLFLSRHRLRDLAGHLGGLAAAASPLIIFDLRHNFYHTHTLWQYFLDTLSRPGQSQITYYHFLNLWPLILIILATILSRMITKKHLLLTALLIFIYLDLNFNSSRVSFNSAVGMPPEFTLATWETAAGLIAADNPSDFNVAALLDFDTRAHPLRYLLRYYYRLSPHAVTRYTDISRLYVVAEKTTSLSPVNYELRGFATPREVLIHPLNSRYSLFTLIK